MDICDVCNEWIEVTQPRDYGYPKVKSTFNRAKILENLNDVKRLYIEKHEMLSAELIEKKIVLVKTSM